MCWAAPYRSLIRRIFLAMTFLTVISYNYVQWRAAWCFPAQRRLGILEKYPVPCRISICVPASLIYTSFLRSPINICICCTYMAGRFQHSWVGFVCRLLQQNKWLFSADGMSSPSSLLPSQKRSINTRSPGLTSQNWVFLAVEWIIRISSLFQSPVL